MYTLAECVRRDSRVRVTRDEAVQVRISTLLLVSSQATRECRLKKKTIKNQSQQPGETRDPLTRTPQRANKARHEQRCHILMAV